MRWPSTRKRIYHKRDRLRQLRAFCRAAQMGSITKAADSLGVNPQTVSVHVRELEHEFDAILFDRSRRNLSLSRAGEHLYRYAEPLVQGMDRVSAAFLEQLADSDARPIYIGAGEAIATFVLPAYYRRFQQLYPELRLRIRTCSLLDGVEQLLEDELEFVVGENDPTLLNRNDVLYHNIECYDLVLITARDHPLAGRKSVTPEEFAALPGVSPIPAEYSRQIQNSLVGRFGVTLWDAIEVGRWGVIKRFVETGLGAAIVPSFCLGENDALSHHPARGIFPPPELWGGHPARQVADAGHHSAPPAHGAAFLRVNPPRAAGQEPGRRERERAEAERMVRSAEFTIVEVLDRDDCEHSVGVTVGALERTVGISNTTERAVRIVVGGAERVLWPSPRRAESAYPMRYL